MRSYLKIRRIHLCGGIAAYLKATTEDPAGEGPRADLQQTLPEAGRVDPTGSPICDNAPTIWAGLGNRADNNGKKHCEKGEP